MIVRVLAEVEGEWKRPRRESLKSKTDRRRDRNFRAHRSEYDRIMEFTIFKRTIHNAMTVPGRLISGSAAMRQNPPDGNAPPRWTFTGSYITWHDCVTTHLLVCTSRRPPRRTGGVDVFPP